MALKAEKLGTSGAGGPRWPMVAAREHLATALIAVAAVDGAIAAGFERDFGRLAALVADGVVEHTLSPRSGGTGAAPSSFASATRTCFTTPLALPSSTTIGATGRLAEAALRVEALFSNRESEWLTAITAGESKILLKHDKPKPLPQGSQSDTLRTE